MRRAEDDETPTAESPSRKIREESNILSKAWYESKKSSPEEERLRIVEAAAAIIREDTRTSVVETKYYPPPNQMLGDVNGETQNSLLYFLQEVIMKNIKGKIEVNKEEDDEQEEN
ncbi:hypothetical protein J6590_107692 [Homalodisca vitripennis]|nr:hypothetical protein J6590_071721 [Homalodisca vitripennis]KAG8313783.1 hypothetical protein J6590_107692 [Homalodisca vitripennis]